MTEATFVAAVLKAMEELCEQGVDPGTPYSVLIAPAEYWGWVPADVKYPWKTGHTICSHRGMRADLILTPYTPHNDVYLIQTKYVEPGALEIVDFKKRYGRPWSR